MQKVFKTLMHLNNIILINFIVYKQNHLHTILNNVKNCAKKLFNQCIIYLQGAVCFIAAHLFS